VKAFDSAFGRGRSISRREKAPLWRTFLMGLEPKLFTATSQTNSVQEAHL
jgi:hypothetical protein